MPRTSRFPRGTRTNVPDTSGDSLVYVRGPLTELWAGVATTTAMRCTIQGSDAAATSGRASENRPKSLIPREFAKNIVPLWITLLKEGPVELPSPEKSRACRSQAKNARQGNPFKIKHLRLLRDL